MSLLERLKKLRNDYITRQVEGVSMPEFTPSPVRRKHFVFSGRVQGVGFRVEVYMLADRLGLTGWVGNRPDGSVEAEIQGEEERVAFLVRYMRSLKRISIQSVDEEDVPLVPAEAEFLVKREYPYDGF